MTTHDAVNKGNFISLLNLLAEFDEKLNHHLQFSIISDEVTSNTQTKRSYLSVYTLLHGGMKHHPLKKFSFYFSYLTTTTGLAIATAIKESLNSLNVDISKARGQAYDGASAMSSNRCGVQAQIQKPASTGIFIHTVGVMCLI